MNLRKRLKGVRVTEQLAEQFERASPNYQVHMLGALEHYVGEFRRADEQQPTPGGRALGVHHVMTIWLEDAAAKPPGGHVVQCRRGCSSCCRLMITVFPDEALLAVFAARAAGVDIDRGRLERQAKARNVVEWRRLSREDRTCVFLRNDECSIYEHRPSSCRKYQVVTPAEHCDTDKHPGHKVGMAVSAMAEILASAAITAWGESLMAPALLRALDSPIDHLTLSPEDPAP